MCYTRILLECANDPLEEEEDSEEESEEEEEEPSAEPTPMDGVQTPSGLETPSGMTSVVSTVAGGLETPDFLELRKNAPTRPSKDEDSGPRSLYQVLEEKQTNVRGLMGSERGYDLRTVSGAAVPVLGEERGTKVRLGAGVFSVKRLTVWSCIQRKANGVEMSIDASELEGMSEEELRKRYDDGSRGRAGVPGQSQEDFSDMVAKEMAKKKQKESERERGKKGKDFKF
jgi:splicing factor 3B subunit 2